MKESGSPLRHLGNSSKRSVPKPSKTGENRLRPAYSGHIFEGQVPPVAKRASGPMSEEDRSTSRARTLLSVVLMLLVVAGAINGALFSSPSTRRESGVPPGAQFAYIVTILMENNGVCNVLTSCGGAAPYLTSLSQNYSLAGSCQSNSACSSGGYTAVDHPSLPNYLSLFSGLAGDCRNGGDTTGGCMPSGGDSTSDCTPSISCTMSGTVNIVDRIEAAGLTWKAWAEDLPSSNPCTGADAYPGFSTVRHFPFFYYTDITLSRTRCSNTSHASTPDDPELIDALGGTATAANFMWLTPDDCDNMHSCPVSTGDNYLKSLIPRILNSYIFKTQKAALFIVFDEGDSAYPNDYTYAMWAGPVVRPGYVATNGYNHYSFLKTLETVWNLPPLQSTDSAASPMTEFFLQNSITPPPTGWGGVFLSEADTFTQSNPSSEVFPGEKASDLEMTASRIVALGYNSMRVQFSSQCPGTQQEAGPYGYAWLRRAVAVAQHYNLWLIVDYHGYNDLSTGSSNVQCWLSFWKPVVENFTRAYPRMIWEPINEPCGPCFGTAGTLSLDSLSADYQSWIDQARSLSDAHWIIVQNLCSYSCSYGLTSQWQGYPTVTDSQKRVLISLHSYFFYDGCTTGWYGTCAWTNSTAASIASTYYQNVLHGMRTTGWPVLNSEGGASYFSEAACTSPSCTPPDTRLVGDAGYAGASFYFINALTSDYDASGHGIGWAWWPTGDWTNSPCPTTSSGGGCLYGALSANMGSAGSVPGWGILLRLPVSLSLTSDFSANSSASNSPEHATTDGFPSRGQPIYRTLPPADI